MIIGDGGTGVDVGKGGAGVTVGDGGAGVIVNNNGVGTIGTGATIGDGGAEVTAGGGRVGVTTGGGGAGVDGVADNGTTVVMVPSVAGEGATDGEGGPRTVRRWSSSLARKEMSVLQGKVAEKYLTIR